MASCILIDIETCTGQAKNLSL